MATCSVAGCNAELNNPKHHFCLTHWRKDRDGLLAKQADGTWTEGGSEPVEEQENDSAARSGGASLSSTKLGQHYNLSAKRMNLVLAELGWIEKYTKGWTPTAQGNKLGAEIREARQTGIPYVVWPESILINKVLNNAIGETLGDTEPPAEVSPQASSRDDSPISDFRERFPAQYRATDGHMVRSRAEMLIDNWLYMQGIVHAFERKLPIEEEVYCDFYLPTSKVYIEYWGMESDPKYAARMQAKQAIYAKYNLNLVELNDDHIMNLDDILPRLLLKFGIDCT